MAAMYTTITAKGQITLPAELRHRFNLTSGQRVEVTADKDAIIVKAPVGIEAVRARIKAEATAAGRWGKRLDPAGAWAEAAAEKLV